MAKPKHDTLIEVFDHYDSIYMCMFSLEVAGVEDISIVISANRPCDAQEVEELLSAEVPDVFKEQG